MNTKCRTLVSCLTALVLTASLAAGDPGNSKKRSMPVRTAKTTTLSSTPTTRTTTTYPTRNYSGTRYYSGSRNYSGTRYYSGSRYYGGSGSSIFIGGGFGYGYPYYGYYPYGYGHYPYDYGYYPYSYGYYSYDRPGYAYAGGSVVAQVQGRLARAGYYRGAIDGAMGPRTHYAIRAYERDHGLRVDGAISGSLLRNMGLRY